MNKLQTLLCTGLLCLSPNTKQNLRADTANRSASAPLESTETQKETTNQTPSKIIDRLNARIRILHPKHPDVQSRTCLKQQANQSRYCIQTRGFKHNTLVTLLLIRTQMIINKLHELADSDTPSKNKNTVEIIIAQNKAELTRLMNSIYIFKYSGFFTEDLTPDTLSPQNSSATDYAFSFLRNTSPLNGKAVSPSSYLFSISNTTHEIAHAAFSDIINAHNTIETTNQWAGINDLSFSEGMAELIHNSIPKSLAQAKAQHFHAKHKPELPLKLLQHFFEFPTQFLFSYNKKSCPSPAYIFNPTAPQSNQLNYHCAALFLSFLQYVTPQTLTQVLQAYQTEELHVINNFASFLQSPDLALKFQAFLHTWHQFNQTYRYNMQKHMFLNLLKPQY